MFPKKILHDFRLSVMIIVGNGLQTHEEEHERMEKRKHHFVLSEGGGSSIHDHGWH